MMQPLVMISPSHGAQSTQRHLSTLTCGLPVDIPDERCDCVVLATLAASVSRAMHAGRPFGREPFDLTLAMFVNATNKDCPSSRRTAFRSGAGANEIQ